MMMPNQANTSNALTLGYDLDMWNEYRVKIPITVDISPDTNSHILVCGMSGSGKSYASLWYFNMLSTAKPDGEFYMADYKGEDAFGFLRECPRYWSFKSTLEALDIVHTRMNARLSGEDKTRNQITLIWDEYMANILSLINEDKKLASVVMNKVSEILLMGRSMSVRIIISCQRPDALAFPAGSRLNYGVVVVLGAALRSVYEMLLPDFRGKAEGRIFGRGEGVALIQGTHLHFIKIPTIRDYKQMQENCIQALS